jgi:hypothetical protein
MFRATSRSFDLLRPAHAAGVDDHLALRSVHDPVVFDLARCRLRSADSVFEWQALDDRLFDDLPIVLMPVATTEDPHPRGIASWLLHACLRLSRSAVAPQARLPRRLVPGREVAGDLLAGPLEARDYLSQADAELVRNRQRHHPPLTK